MPVSVSVTLTHGIVLCSFIWVVRAVGVDVWACFGGLVFLREGEGTDRLKRGDVTSLSSEQQASVVSTTHGFAESIGYDIACLKRSHLTNELVLIIFNYIY